MQTLTVDQLSRNDDPYVTVWHMRPKITKKKKKKTNLILRKSNEKSQEGNGLTRGYFYGLSNAVALLKLELTGLKTPQPHKFIKWRCGLAKKGLDEKLGALYFRLDLVQNCMV